MGVFLSNSHALVQNVAVLATHDKPVVESEAKIVRKDQKQERTRLMAKIFTVAMFIFSVLLLRQPLIGLICPFFCVVSFTESHLLEKRHRYLYQHLPDTKCIVLQTIQGLEKKSEQKAEAIKHQVKVVTSNPTDSVARDAMPALAENYMKKGIELEGLTQQEYEDRKEYLALMSDVKQITLRPAPPTVDPKLWSKLQTQCRTFLDPSVN